VVPDRLEGAGGWSLDHLFVDQDAIPTLVEVKRAANSQLRREVVGQLLDYAANAVRYWSISDLTRFVRSHPSCRRGTSSGGAHRRGDGRGGVLAPGRRQPSQMVVCGWCSLADRIPTELQAIVEFLNERLEPTEVLAIELRQYRTPDGLQVLVPRVIGQTAVAKAGKENAVSYAERLDGAPASTREMEQQPLNAWAGRGRDRRSQVSALHAGLAAGTPDGENGGGPSPRASVACSPSRLGVSMKPGPARYHRLFLRGRGSDS
jgi:hypothetical protein